MTDSTTLRAVSAPVAAVDETQADLGALVADVLAESRVELPDGMAAQIARTVAARSRRFLLAMGWSMYRAGVDRNVANDAGDAITQRRDTAEFARTCPK